MGINYTISNSLIQDDTITLHSDLSSAFLQKCDNTGPLYDYSHVQKIFYNVLLNCGYELQQLQNSYNAFDLLSEVGSQIHLHFQHLRQYKHRQNVSNNIYSRLRQLRYTPIAYNQYNSIIRIDAISKSLDRVTRGINIWAYNSDSVSNDGSSIPPINCLIFDHTGRVIITGGGNGIVKIWHSDTGGQIMSLSRHPGAITSLDIHLNNIYLSSACDGGECRLWELRGSWWRLSCTIISRFKFLWCKFTTLNKNISDSDDILICSCGDGSMQLHLLINLINGIDTPITTVNLTNLRAYDISRGQISWLAMGLESGDTDSSDKPSKLGVATIVELDYTNWSNNSKIKHHFLWDIPNPDLWTLLQESGYLSQLNPDPPLALVQLGQYSHKFSLTIINEENSNIINSIPKSAFSIVSSSHQESPDVCFANRSRNLVTASDDGNAFLWNMYTGDSIKLITKCMTLYESKISKQSDNSTYPIYTITCLEWSCDDSLIYIGDSIYSKGNSRKSISSMRTIESGFTVFNSINGLPIGHGLHKESCYNLSAIKANPRIPFISLVISYSGSIYIMKSDTKSDPSILKKINCGPGACWLDAAWHPNGFTFILSQKYGCFSIFTLPTFTFSSCDIAYNLDESIPCLKGDRFSFGCSNLVTLPAHGFVPLHYSLCPDLSTLSPPEPSILGNLEKVDDLDICQKCDLKRFIYAHVTYEHDFDNIISCFHHLQIGNFDFIERFHDWKGCKICCAIHFNDSNYKRGQNRRAPPDHYSEYGDHIPCLPPTVKSQIKSLRDSAPRVQAKNRSGILLRLLEAPTFDSDDSDDSDFTASPPPRTRRVTNYSTRLSSRCRSSSSSSSSEDDAPRRRRRKRPNGTIQNSSSVSANTSHNTTLPRPKVIKFDISSIDYLLSGETHQCFICATSTVPRISSDFMISSNDLLVGPIIMDRQSMEAIVSNVGNGELLIEDAKSSRHALIYLHHYCLVSMDSISIQSNGIIGLDVSLYRASETKCTLCDRNGAALHCKNCNLPYHTKCSISIYNGYRIYPNAVTGDFICLRCSREVASDFMAGLIFSTLSRDWLFGGWDPQARTTRSRLRAQLAFRRVMGKGSEWILPQEGDILWFKGLSFDSLIQSDRLIPLYLHYAHVSFAALVIGVTPLFSGYGITPQLIFNLRVLILPPHPCFGIEISIHSYRNDSRYILMNKLILGLLVQNMLSEDDNLLVYDSMEWRSARVVVNNSRCRRLLDFDCMGSELIKRLDRAINAAKDGIRIKVNNKREEVISTLCGWQIEPTGEILNVVGTIAEQILESEFSEKQREICEEVLAKLDQFPRKNELDDLNSTLVDKVPRPIGLNDISQALSNGLLRQITSFDELIRLKISNCNIGLRESQIDDDLLNQFSNYYEGLRQRMDLPSDLMSSALDRLGVICKIAFYKQSR